MRKYGYKILTIILVIFNSVLELHSQDDCEQRLSQAISLFSEGKYTECIGLLEDRINTCKLSKTDFAEASKILSSAYFELDELEKGDEIVNKLLNNQPTFVPNRNTDPYLFVNAIEKFTVRPRFEIGLGGTMDYPKIIVLKRYRILQNGDYSKDYADERGGGFQLRFFWNITNNLALSSGFCYNNYFFNREIRINRRLTTKTQETLDLFSIPVLLDYSFRFLKFKGFYPSVSAGIGFNRINEAELELSFNVDFKEDDFSGGGIGFAGMLEKHTVSLNGGQRVSEYASFIAGGRANYEFSRFVLYLGFNYIYVPSSLVTDQGRYNDPQQFGEFYYVSDDYRYNAFQLNFGFAWKFGYKVANKYSKNWFNP